MIVEAKSLPVKVNNSTIEIHLPVEANEKLAIIDSKCGSLVEASHSTANSNNWALRQMLSRFHPWKAFILPSSPIDHFTVVCSATWPVDGSEARVDLVLIQTSLLLSCKSTLLPSEQLVLHNKRSEVCIKTRSTLASLPSKGQVTKQTTVNWSIVSQPLGADLGGGCRGCALLPEMTCLLFRIRY